MYHHRVKTTILIALMIASLALARGITSKAVEEDEDNDNQNDNNNNNNNNSNNEQQLVDRTMESDVELASAALIPSSTATTATAAECALAANAPTDRTSGNTDEQTRLPSSARAIIDKMDGNKRINIGKLMNLDRIRNGLMRASSYPSSSSSSSNIWQILDSLDWPLRPSEIRESIASIIPNLIDPLMPPQMQYVDNTLRMMAIKNSMDDLLAKIFPNLHMIQHPTEQKNN